LPSLKSRFFYYAVKRQLRKFALRGGSLEQVRAARDKSSQRMFPAPVGVQVQAAHLGDCPGEWLRPDRASADSVILYLHGGAYITGSCHTHRGLAGHVAKAAGLDCFLLDYRLAPEHPFPAAVDDAHAAYLALHAQNPHRTIVLAGDSAGGGLALALALRLRDAGHVAPGAMALLSPWTDLTLSLPTHQSKAAVDPFFPDTSTLSMAAQLYAGAKDLAHPLASPHFAALHGLPRTLIHVGEHEALLGDAHALVANMQAAGSPVQLQAFEGMWHVWQIFAGRFAEADASVKQLGKFLRAA
jgi:monoterpene epsilon-lactone hydrolase